MNKYNSKIHHRTSIRLKGYDYAQAGLYFVTICCQHRTCFFGEIMNGEMILNAAGKMIEKWYDELENKFPDIKCQEMIVMPNHFHCIIENIGSVQVGADLRVRPNTHNQPNNILGEPNNILGEPNNILDKSNPILGEHNPIMGEHIGSPLHRVVQWFKTMTTNEYIRNVKSNNWQRFDGKLWQRNYWEHIIRNEKSYHTISEYIKKNPQNWKNDTLH